MKTTCKECGYPLSGAEKVCPECGSPIQNGNVLTDENVLIDDYDYSQFYDCSWLLRPWYFNCEKDSEKENFDQLNDIFLLSAIVFRIFLRALMVYIILTIINVILNLILVEAGAQSVTLITNFLIPLVAVFAVIYFVFKGLAKYWVPFLRTFRRINKRYWIMMHKSVKNNTVDNL